MTAVRRLLLLLPAACVLLAGCGGSLATQQSSARTVTTTQAQASSPFCEAVQAGQDAAQPVTGLGIGRSVDDVEQVAANLRRANQQVTSLAPQEIRADFDRVNQLAERQLQVLEANGGDTMALARDPELAQQRSDPAYQEASQRVNDYVRSHCPR